MALLQNPPNATGKEINESQTPDHRHIPIQGESRIITGSATIDRIIHEIFPEIGIISIEEIGIISIIIKNHIFGISSRIEIIEDKTNPITADFVEGMAIIAQENGIETIEELETYYDAFVEGIGIRTPCPVS